MDAQSTPKLERVTPESPLTESEPAGAFKKLAILSPPSHPVRDGRAVTNLGRVFGQFADLQQQIAEQVGALEDSVHQQKQDLAAASAQLPELRERINWLIASFYEQSKKDEAVRERLARHDAAIDSLNESLRLMHEQNGRWHAAFDGVIEALMRAKASLPRE